MLSEKSDSLDGHLKVKDLPHPLYYFADEIRNDSKSVTNTGNQIYTIMLKCRYGSTPKDEYLNLQSQLKPTQQPTNESQLQPSLCSHSPIPNLDTARKRSRQMRQLIRASIIENWDDLSPNNKFTVKDDHNIIFEVSYSLDHPNSTNPTVFTYLDLIS